MKFIDTYVIPDHKYLMRINVFDRKILHIINTSTFFVSIEELMQFI